jgi:hypothetical protein
MGEGVDREAWNAFGAEVFREVDVHRGGRAEKQRWRLLPGVVTRKEARAKLPEIERKVAQGIRDPLEKPIEPTSATNLMNKWAASLTIRTGSIALE